MTCEEVELELPGELSPTAKAHLAGCADCQQTSRVLGLAAMPDLGSVERLALSTLPATVERAARREPPRASFAKQALGYALAAGLGALLASGVVLKLRPTPVEQVKEPVTLTEANFSDDEVFLEVGWPSPTEGDL